MGANESTRPPPAEPKAVLRGRVGSRPIIRREEVEPPPAPREDERVQQLQWELDQLRAHLQPDRRKPESKPPATKAHWMAHLAAVLTALAALVTVLVTLVNAMAALRKPPDGMVTKAEFDKALTQQRAVNETTRAYESSFREQVMGVWELQGVKVTDPPGTSPRVPLPVLPPPLVGQKKSGATKVPAAPLIQIGEPIVAPPPLP